MKILAHRGCWNTEIKSNSPQAIRSALERGFGFESDLRDYSGKLVISHDIACELCQKAEEVFQWLEEFNDQHCLNFINEDLPTLRAKARLSQCP